MIKKLPISVVMTQKHQLDVPLLVAVMLLTLFGLVMVYDASAAQAFQNYQDKYFFIKQQFIWVILGILAMTLLSIFNYQHFKKLALPILLLAFGLLLLVFVPGLGVSALGANRWLNIGFINIQPVEIIKLASVIFFSALFQKGVKTMPFLIIFAMVAIIVGLMQKDLGSTVVYTVIALGLYFLAGAPLKYFFALVPLVLLGGAIFTLSSAYRLKRVLAFFDPFSDPQGFSYHISQILIALGSGGWFGLGIGQSRQKFNFIPEVTTDSIFAVIGEELGFLGSAALILLISFILFRIFRIAQNSQDPLGKLLASGIGLWLGAQVIVNLSAMVAIIPLTGVPLPFISYGGSALLTNLVAIGILLNISKSTHLTPGVGIL